MPENPVYGTKRYLGLQQQTIPLDTRMTRNGKNNFFLAIYLAIYLAIELV